MSNLDLEYFQSFKTTLWYLNNSILALIKKRGKNHTLLVYVDHICLEFNRGGLTTIAVI